MHGLINRSIQCFLAETYGVAAWQVISEQAGLGQENLETLILYDDTLTESLLESAVQQTGNTRSVLLEDLGTFLVTSPTMHGLRRLLRFGGAQFVDFLHSLEELPDRARMAVSDLTLPQIELRDHSAVAFTLLVTHDFAGFGHVILGVLRAMADDYGALALLSHEGRRDKVETITVEVFEVAFSEGRNFDLIAQSP